MRRMMTSNGSPCCSYTEKKNAGNMINIMKIPAILSPNSPLHKKYTVSPSPMPIAKQTICRKVRPKRNLLFTVSISTGTGIYNSLFFSILSPSMCSKNRFRYAVCLTNCKQQHTGICNIRPHRADNIGGIEYVLHHGCVD